MLYLRSMTEKRISPGRSRWDKHRGRPLELFIDEQREAILSNIITGLQQILASPENTIGLQTVVIFGSWTRKGKHGPHTQSDLDLFGHVEDVPHARETLMQELISGGLDKRGIDIEAVVFSKIITEDVRLILEGKDSWTKHGYILITSSNVVDGRR